MKNFIKLISAGLVLSMFFICAIASSSSNDETGASKVGEVTAADEEASAEETETEETAAALKDEYHVGDELIVDDMRIVYVASGEYVSDNEYLTPDEGNKYIFIKLFCENQGEDDNTVTFYDFDCYADGYAADMAYINDDTLSATLSSGRSITGSIVFEVPEDASEIEIEYECNWITEEKILFVYDGDSDSGFVADTVAEASENAYSVGDIVENSDLRISYIECGEYISDNSFIQPADGNHYIYFKFEFENISDSDQYVSFYDFDCYADGINCDQTYSDDDLSATISSGRIANGTVTFEVPLDAEIIECEFVNNAFTSDRIVFTYSE